MESMSCIEFRARASGDLIRFPINPLCPWASDRAGRHVAMTEPRRQDGVQAADTRAEPYEARATARGARAGGAAPARHHPPALLARHAMGLLRTGPPWPGAPHALPLPSRLACSPTVPSCVSLKLACAACMGDRLERHHAAYASHASGRLVLERGIAVGKRTWRVEATSY